MISLPQRASRPIRIGQEREGRCWDPKRVASVRKRALYIEGCLDDCKKLWKDHRVSVRNCVDLALLARSADNTRWKGPYKGGIGLSRLADTYLGQKLAKGRVQTSNWEAELSTQQKECEDVILFLLCHVEWIADAANDCHSSVAIYRTLKQRALRMERVPEEDWYTFDAIKGVLRDDVGRPWFPFNPHYDPGPPPCTAHSDVIALMSQ